MAFAEPSSVFNAINPEQSQPTEVVLRDATGLALEVRHLTDLGWWLELRFDQRDEGACAATLYRSAG